MVANGHMGQKVLFEDAFVDGLECVGLVTFPQNRSFLIKIECTSGSTAMLTAHKSILSPGELIHLRVLVSSSLLEFRESSPSYDSLQPA